MKFSKVLLLAIAFAVGSTARLHADSPAEMMEKGIYNEDTIGNLDEAIKIYRKVVAAAGETEVLAAKAQYRLGQCLLKQGKKEEAIAAFQDVLTKFPNQREIIKKAKQHLPEILQSTPWKDGERLTMEMKLPGGQAIGLIGVGVNSGQLDGHDIWEMTIRRFVGGGNNEGVSKVWVDQKTFRPYRTVFDHTVLGTTDATWTDESISMVKKVPGAEDTKSEVTMDELAFSNDQVFYGFRQLPLKVGYEVTVPIRVAFTGGNAIGLEVNVSKKEKIETPAGTFDCFRLDTNISQTFWIADVPERYIVQFEAGGVIAKLTEITHDDKAKQYENDELGFSCTVPKGWFYIERKSSNQETSGGIQMVAPEMASASIYVKDKSLLNDKERNSLKAWMEAKIKRSEAAFKDFKIGPEGIQETKLGNLDGLAISAQQGVAKRDVVFGLTLGLGEEKSSQLATNASKDQAAARKNSLMPSETHSS